MLQHPVTRDYNGFHGVAAATRNKKCNMATIRRREWRTPAGEAREAWQVDFVDQEGKRRHKQFRRKKEADAYLTRARSQVAAGTYTAESTSSTIQQATDAWIKRGEAEGLERSTLEQRRQHKIHILAVIDPGTRLARISVSRLEALRDELLARHSRPTARKIVTSLKAILKQAKAVHLATADLAIKGASRHRKRLEVGVDIPTPEEVKALVQAASGNTLVLICLAAFAGLRASEIRGLRWSDVDLGQHPTVTVAQRADRWAQIGSPKSQTSRRTVPLTETTTKALRAWKLAQPPIVTKDDEGNEIKRPRTLVFGTGTDRPETLPNLRARLLGPAMLKAGVAVPVIDDDGKPVKDKDGKPVTRPKYTGLHSLRHYAISAWLRTCAGDFKLVQTWAGHASLTMTLDRYGHLLTPKGRDQIADAERGLWG
jgi:integrase